jgi:hypothetical protein
MHPAKARRLQGGFLLLESLMVVLIVATGLTVVLRSFGSSLHALGTSAEYTRALLLLEDRLWDLEAKGSIAPGVLSGKFEEDEDFRWEVEAREGTPPELCETHVTVRWERRGRPRAVSVVTYLKRATT